MTISINIDDQKNTAQVVLTEKGLQTVKTLQLSDLSDVFKNLTATEKDTGYLSNNLLREAVKNAVCRAYYFKEYITTFQYTTRTNLPVKKNKYNITLEKQDEGSNRLTLVIPNFKFTNILGFIANSNTDAFNPSCYQILSVTPDLFGNIGDASRTVRFFPNQWDTHICWPNTFNKEILSNKAIGVQSAFVTQYLNSKFNSDLYEEKISINKLEQYKTELDSFFNEVVGMTSSDLHNNDYVGWFYLVYYFLVTIKNIEPATLANRTNTLKSYFDSYL